MIRPIDTVAPAESDTPNPTSFPDDILTYLTTTHDEAIIVYLADLETCEELVSLFNAIVDIHSTVRRMIQDLNR